MTKYEEIGILFTFILLFGLVFIGFTLAGFRLMETLWDHKIVDFFYLLLFLFIGFILGRLATQKHD